MRCFSSFLHGPWVLVNQSRSPRKGRVCGIFKMAARFFFFWLRVAYGRLGF